MGYFLVTESQGPAWNPDRRRREQVGFQEHAAIMDELTGLGTILLGGPVGNDVDIGDALLVICADDDADVRAQLSADPWLGNVLTIKSVQKWNLWLRSPQLQARLTEP